MRQLLARMSVISEVPALNLDPSDRPRVSTGRSAATPPRGSSQTMAGLWAGIYNRADSHERRCQVVRDAEDALSRVLLSPVHLIPGTWEWRVAIARAQGTISEIARVYGCDRKQVYRIRRAA
jgi:hypothetical protein